MRPDFDLIGGNVLGFLLYALSVQNISDAMELIFKSMSVVSVGLTILIAKNKLAENNKKPKK